MPSNNMIFILLSLFCIFIIGCTQKQVYYKNTRYIGDTQAYLHRDSQYCEAIAQVARPNTQIYIPEGPTTTHGHGIVTDNHGNVYHGTYQQTTYPDTNQDFYRGLNSLNSSIQASNVYLAVKEQCLAQLGWYQISQTEYIQSQQQPQQQIYLKFTSNKPGAIVYSRTLPSDEYIKVEKHRTPFILYGKQGTTHLVPECYKAELDGVVTNEICFEQNNATREITFTF